MTECEARVRSCPRGGQHYTEQEYASMSLQDDVRLPITPKPRAGTALAKAQEAYMEASKDYYSAEVQRFRLKEMKRLNIDPESWHKGYEKMHKSVARLSGFSRTYMEMHNVPSQHSFRALHAMSSTSPNFSLEKTNDPKTNAVFEKLENNPIFKKLQEKAVEARDMFSNSQALQADMEKRFSRSESAIRIHAAEAELQRAKKWARAGVPDDAKEVNVNSITPDKLSYDKWGYINNVWIDSDRKMSRVGAVENAGSEAPQMMSIGGNKPLYHTGNILLGPKNDHPQE